MGESQAIGIDGDVADRRAHLHRNRDPAPEGEFGGIRHKLKVVMQRHNRVGQNLARIILGRLRRQRARQQGQQPKPQAAKILHDCFPAIARRQSIRAARIYNARAAQYLLPPRTSTRRLLPVNDEPA